MPPDVIARAFDPFFTTKPLEKGTGLGLSMIYGFARQSGGEASIDSRMGEGTTIRIGLPFASGEAEGRHVATLPQASEGKGERILVEDDEAVRVLVVGALEEAGHLVRSAADGPTGLLQLQDVSGNFDLLVSDVGLPGLNGRQMADGARVETPTLKILFMTGYAESATLAKGSLEAGMALIAKPFLIDALLAKVRFILNASV